MISLETIRTAVLAEQPWVALDNLVKAEQAAGRRVKEIYTELSSLVEPVREAVPLSDDADDAIRDTLDALLGNCAKRWRYLDPPNESLPTEEEIAELPQWARVAFAARCVRRVLPQFKRVWLDGPTEDQSQVHEEYLFLSALSTLVERVALTRSPYSHESGWEFASKARKISSRAFGVGQAEATNWASSGRAVIRGRAAFGEIAGRIASAISFAVDSVVHVSPKGDTKFAVYTAADAAASLPNAHRGYVRRDFDHLMHLADWQQWADDTPVSPDVFGPLWPEGPPKNWPADPDVPQHSTFNIEVSKPDNKREQILLDETLNIFNALNHYHIARGGQPLTLSDLKPLISSLVFAGV